MNSLPRFIFLLLVIFFVCVGCGKSEKDADSAKDAGSDKKPAAAPYGVQVLTVSSGEAQESRTILGRLIEINRATVSSEVSGRLEAIAVEEGSPVVGGETQIALVDTTWNEFALKQTTAQIEALKAKKDYQESELRRIRPLMADKAISESEVDSTQATLDELSAEVDAKVALLHEIEKRIERSKIIAPFTGEVVKKFVDVGAYVTPGTPVAEIISSGKIDARIYIPETFIQRIEIGQKIDIHIDALDETVPGVVEQIVGSAETASRTFPVRVRIDDLGGKLKAGMSVTTQIPVTDRFEALLVPTDSVLVKPDGKTIWIVIEEAGEDGKPCMVAQPVAVRVLADMQRTLAIEPIQKDGRGGEYAALLVEGAQVVVEGAERLSPGREVAIVKSKYQLKPLPGMYESGQQRRMD